MANKKTSTSKKRANKYEEKVKVDASFDELMTVLFPKVEKKDKEPVAKKPKKSPPKKK